jgi:hypothetical protein
VNSFTLEASFCGSDSLDKKGFHYNTQHLHDMGNAIGIALFEYFSPPTPSPQDESLVVNMAAVAAEQHPEKVLSVVQDIQKGLELKNPEFLPYER